MDITAVAMLEPEASSPRIRGRGNVECRASKNPWTPKPLAWTTRSGIGKPAYTYNFLGLARYTIEAPDALASGPATVTLDFAYDGGGVGKGGKVTLYVNGKPVAEGRIEKTQPNIFSADETADVGIDDQTPVAEGIGIGPETRFTGKINQVTLEVQ